MDLAQVATDEQADLTRAEHVAVLETLRDTLVKIDAGELDRRDVDFGTMAEDLDRCIAEVARLDEDGYERGAQPLGGAPGGRHRPAGCRGGVRCPRRGI